MNGKGIDHRRNDSTNFTDQRAMVAGHPSRASSSQGKIDSSQYADEKEAKPVPAGECLNEALFTLSGQEKNHRVSHRGRRGH